MQIQIVDQSLDTSIYEQQEYDECSQPFSQDSYCEEFYLEDDTASTEIKYEPQEVKKVEAKSTMDQVKRIRLKSIQLQKDLLMNRLKQLQDEQSALGGNQKAALNQPFKKRSFSHEDKKESKQQVKVKSVKKDQNPFTTRVRMNIPDIQRQYLQKIQSLTEEQLVQVLKGFGMKKASKKQMIFLLQKIKSYTTNEFQRNPYYNEVIKKKH